MRKNFREEKWRFRAGEINSERDARKSEKVREMKDPPIAVNRNAQTATANEREPSRL
jgi:hypothetical protein